MSDLRSKLQLLTIDMKLFKKEKEKDTERIRHLQTELSEMKSYTANLVETVNKQLHSQT